jgi:hypothetical protein
MTAPRKRSMADERVSPLPMTAAPRSIPSSPVNLTATPEPNGEPMDRFREVLRVQRWDDHRYYHHSRINQSLHLVSALSFLCAYAVAFKDPALAAAIGWLVAMTSRQIGHFFFEPKGYDKVNQASHEYKEQIKVGYNLQRKRVLLAVWALSPLPLLVDPTLFGLCAPAADASGFVRHVAQIWLLVGLAGLLFRTVQLCVVQDMLTGLAWATKILTDPFHDIKLYYRAPLCVIRGEFIDPDHAQHGHEAWSDDEEWAEDGPAPRTV